MTTTIQNNNRAQIINLLDRAQSSVQIAVAWLTDEVLIRKLSEVVQKKKVELLLSCDALNVWRYSAIKDLQNKGAKVLKTGTQAPGEKGFMHAKFMIIDGKVAFGGSFNFTDAANYNYENFKEYAKSEVQALLTDFQSWRTSAMDYSIGFENPQAIKEIVIRNFELQEQMRQKLIENCAVDQRDSLTKVFTERDTLIKAEMEKEKKRGMVNSVQNNSITLARNGNLENNVSGITSKPHRFYGGRLLSKFNSQRIPNSFSYSLLQKMEIEKKYSFLKCRIVNDTLICRGIFHPEHCNSYDVRIEYRAGIFPQVYILNPEIKPNAEIHIYREGSLCLFYPGDLKWKHNTSIAENTIPWIFEWILFYELYLLTGLWEGDYVPHGTVRTFSEGILN